VDLSALAARARQAAPAAAPAAAGGASGADDPTNGAAAGAAGAGSAPLAAVIEVTEANFQTEVLQRSLRTPVVVDFWAEWCGPCKQLSPLLEKLAAGAAGRWVLATIDVDANQRLAQAFRVQSIPTVYAVVGGQPLDGFSGALPESQLRQWLDALLQAAAEAGVVGSANGADAPAGPVTPLVDPRQLAAEDKLLAGDFDGAEADYQAILAESPADEDARAGLTQVRLLRRLEGVDPTRVLAAADAAPSDLSAQLTAADIELVSGEAERAYARLVAAVRRTSGDDRESARKHLVELFSLAAPDDPLVMSARRALTSALF
jgi:putative thioredoxin